MVAGQRRPELTFLISNAFIPFSAHCEASWGLQQTHSHSNLKKSMEFNGSPVHSLEEASKFKADGRMVGGAVGNGGDLH